MFSWKGTLSLAVCAALASATFARGASPANSAVADQLSLTPAYLDDATPPPPPPPLMGLLDATPVGKALTAANISITGFVEGGYTLSFNHPAGGYITGNVFNIKDNRVVLDQLDANITRTIDPTAGKFDIGGTVEVQYGFDNGSFHSDGIQDFYRSRISPENQFDLTQAFLTFATPVKGLEITAGKFVTPIGYEVIDAPSNALYSHSYLFGDAIPFTQTGVLVAYTDPNSIMTITGGITRGWNQSSKDNNGSPDFLGSILWNASKTVAVTLNVSFGPQAAHDNHDYWTLADLIVTDQVSDNLKVAFNGDYGDAPHALGNGSAQWFGGAAYASYTLNSYATLNFRGEAYDDASGFTLGNGDMRVYEVTGGVAVTPLPNDANLKNLMIRPEVRADYADKAYFNGGARHDQVQFAVDAIFKF